ncbi:Zinc finger protein CONSTANS-LIKE 5 [Cardamine amara subsp. amara]|uniref:Zinc finger protein CONSTANS-LIKE 5 n=1 Tax=Cardamine amara subsp. amara TaxID=228776 RepID=A0ABD1C816_CARAN
MASSDLYIFDGSSLSSSSIFRNSIPEMFSSDTTTTTDLFCNNEFYSVDESLSIFDHFVPQNILSSSPPSDLLETLTLSQQIPTGLYPNFSDFQISDAVKTEKFFDGGGSGHNHIASMARSYSAIENAGRYMQRSFSSKSVDGKPNQVPFNIPMMDSSNLHYNTLNSPENAFFSGQMRRVYSTGDLQNNIEMKRSSENTSAPLSEEHNFKVGRYSAEERKEKISKYRAKRNQRNFTKTIKYACRKTLADSRPRIRGRFARNDEVVEIPNNEDDDAELWKLDGLHEEEASVGSFVVQQSHLQYTTSFASSFW